MDIISKELCLKDLSYLESNIDKLEKLCIRGNDKSKKPELDTLKKVEEVLKSGKFVRQNDWNEKDIEILNKHLFLTGKPIVYLVNLSEQDYTKKVNFWFFIIIQCSKFLEK